MYSLDDQTMPKGGRMLELIAKKFNHQSLKEQTTRNLVQYLDQKSKIKDLLKLIYETKLSEGVIREPKIYFVSGFIMNPILWLWNRTRVDRGWHLNNNLILINIDFPDLERTLLHEIIHFLGMGYPEGRYQTGFYKNESWKIFNEVLTEYFARVWIFEDEPRTVNTTYKGPYLELKKFANSITNEMFFELYVDNRNDMIEEWLNSENMPISEWLDMFSDFNSKDGFNRIYLDKINDFLENVSKYYKKEE